MPLTRSVFVDPQIMHSLLIGCHAIPRALILSDRLVDDPFRYNPVDENLAANAASIVPDVPGKLVLSIDMALRYLPVKYINESLDKVISSGMLVGVPDSVPPICLCQTFVPLFFLSRARTMSENPLPSASVVPPGQVMLSLRLAAIKRPVLFTAIPAPATALFPH